jgi:hypothetical protein
MEGGCLCGAVRYRLGEAPRDVGWCHCRNCQLNSGSPAMAFGTVREELFTLQGGAETIRLFASSADAERYFCGRCGTPLYVTEHREPGELYVSVATLDDPAATPPGFHIFTAQRIEWAPICDGLPVYEGFRRDPNAARDGG